MGLRSVSGDIEFDKLNFSEPFRQYLKKKIVNFDVYIDKLEKLCSVIFAFSFLIVFAAFSFLLYVTIFVAGVHLVNRFIPEGAQTIIRRVLIISFALLGLIVFVDFITLGALKKIKASWFSRIYFIINRIFSYLTLSFLWRPLLLNFMDQKFTKTLFLLVIPYLFLLLSVAGLRYEDRDYGLIFDHTFSSLAWSQSSYVSTQHAYTPFFYDDQRDKLDQDRTRIDLASIPSKNISMHTGEIFVSRHHKDNKMVEYLDSTCIPINKVGIKGGFWEGFSAGAGFSFDPEKKNKKARKAQLKVWKNEKKERAKLLSSITEVEKLDSLYRYKKDSMRSAHEKEEEALYEQNLIKIKQTLTEAVMLSVDSKQVDRSCIRCDFYRHTNAGEHGLLCTFPLDSLENGRHDLQLYRQIHGGDGLDTLRMIIPFIYEKP